MSESVFDAFEEEEEPVDEEEQMEEEFEEAKEEEEELGLFSGEEEYEEGSIEEAKREETEKEDEEETTEETEKNVKEQEKEEPEPKSEEPEEVEEQEKESSRTESEVPTAQPMFGNETQDFKFEEAGIPTKTVYLIYGLKGEGKTYTAMTFPGKVACLSFDNKSSVVKKFQFNNTDRIRVYNAVKPLDSRTPERYLNTSETTFQWVNFLLDKIEEKIEPNWIVIDGTHIAKRITEMVMRARNNLMPLEGVPWQYWKVRKTLLRQLFTRALATAKRGVIYTTYTEIKEIDEEETKDERPVWLDIIRDQTDTVIHVWSNRTQQQGRRFFFEIASSKIPALETGMREDITDKKITDFADKPEQL